jgi:hypothetical protein
MSCCNNSSLNQNINNVYDKNNYYGGNYPMNRTQQDLLNLNKFNSKPIIENYCSNNQAQATLSLQDNDNPSSYRAYKC